MEFTLSLFDNGSRHLQSVAERTEKAASGKKGQYKRDINGDG